MKSFTRIVLLAATATLPLLASLTHSADNRMDRFTHSGRTQDEGGPALGRDVFTEAPAGFDNRTNGFNVQGPAYDTIDEDNVEALRSFNDNRFIFEEVEEAIRRHGGQAAAVRDLYNALTDEQRRQVLAFLDSL